MGKNVRTKEELTILVHEAARKYAKKKKMRKDLCGLCMISSYALALLMREEGYEADIILGKTYYNTHCWVESDTIVYDATFSQFKYQSKPFYIGKETTTHEVFKRREKNRGFEEFTNTDSRQKPTPRKILNFIKEIDAN